MNFTSQLLIKWKSRYTNKWKIFLFSWINIFCFFFCFFTFRFKCIERINGRALRSVDGLTLNEYQNNKIFSDTLFSVETILSTLFLFFSYFVRFKCVGCDVYLAGSHTKAPTCVCCALCRAHNIDKHTVVTYIHKMIKNT